MPLIYAIHAAIVAVGGMGDWTFRIFDLGASALIGALAASLVWPAGRGLALLAAVSIVLTHLMLGPLAGGQRDYILLIPMLSVAILSIRLAEGATGQVELLVFIGILSALATLLKPTAALLSLTPFVIKRFQLRDLLWVLTGGLAVAVSATAALLVMGALAPFVEILLTYAPTYGLMDRLSLYDLLTKASAYILHLSGFLLAAVVTLHGRQSARARTMMVLTIFGLLHFIIQRKGYFYQAYPLIAGVACWGAWSIRNVPLRIGVLALALIGMLFGLRIKSTVANVYALDPNAMPSAASALMERALSTHLSRGARVQMLDTGDTAFLAMARAGMRQATPYAYWFFLRPEYTAWRVAFIKQLQSSTPDAILLANSSWARDRSKLDAEWPEFSEQLRCCFVLVEDHIVTSPSYSYTWAGTSPSWQLYLRRNVIPR